MSSRASTRLLILLPASALAAELAAATALLVPVPAVTSPMDFYLSVHLTASALSAPLLYRLFPLHHRRQPLAAPTTLFILAFFIPVLGLAGLLLALLPALHRPRRTPPRLYEAIEIPGLPFKPLEVSEQPLFGQAGLASVIRNAPDPEKRVRAVMATRQLRDRDAVPILRIALRDPVDDVRLLAYSLLDAKEQRLNETISILLEERRSASPLHRIRLEERLAGLYWELAYLGLATGEVREHVLSKALEHIEAAEKGSPDAMGIHFQKGRILLRLGRLEPAQSALERARDLGLDPNDVDPYLAEIHFLRRQWDGVRRHLAGIHPLARLEPPLSLLHAYWVNKGT